MKDIDFEARLLELAHAQAATKAAEAKLAEVVAATVDPLRNAVALAQNEEERLERKLREDVMAYVQESGDLRPHSHLSFRRTTKLIYDKEYVLDEVQALGRSDLFHTLTTLDVRAFEKAFNAGELPNIEAELVNAPTVAISKLGDLLIKAEVDARSKDGSL